MELLRKRLVRTALVVSQKLKPKKLRKKLNPILIPLLLLLHLVAT
jgi:hypothetical protein